MTEKETFTSSSRPAGSATAGGAGPAAARRDPRVVELEHEVDQLQQQVTELEDRWRRALADLDNLRKRYERESVQQRARERVEVASAWLPVLDHLELALAHAKANPAAIVEGVRGVRDQALAVLARLGFSRRDDVGAAFDPARHEAVATTPAHHVPAGTVLEVVRPAYGEGEHQLRPASVVVAAGHDNGQDNGRDNGGDTGGDNGRDTDAAGSDQDTDTEAGGGHAGQDRSNSGA